MTPRRESRSVYALLRTLPGPVLLAIVAVIYLALAQFVVVLDATVDTFCVAAGVQAIADSGLEITDANRARTGLVFGADENPPTHAKVSRWVSPIWSACPPPIDSPAIARSSRLRLTLYSRLTTGITSLNRILS